ncbi:Na+/H+ antiporter subunit A [Metabacillus sp. GX 13764]|uniref:Na+/H+ antiporter subunit A n=1 Tax=Metabacillus kandeliae TaxID=2900151 RepID=UPI001E6321AF|nr:Na+/H+ antiporter subunit A [Metabacillus kandeliae]MCD7035739.1 Na+/H+ antiporter subunit A [Metabacillus kandeliae]
MTFLHFSILFPFLFAVFVPFLYKKFRSIHTGWFVLLVPVLLLIFFLTQLPVTANEQTAISTIDWIPSLGIQFTVYLDGLSFLFSLLITGIGSLVTLYSIFYLDQKKEKLNSFYVFFLLFMGSMLGVVLSDNMVVLYTFWELTSISSFLLIGYWHHRKESTYGAQKSMIITVFGGLCMLGGMILLYLITNTFSIRETILQADHILQHPFMLPALILFLLGAFTKSAQFPFYIWLPDAMEAPTPVSAYLHSATMVKAGIYLVARFTPVFGPAPEWFWIVTLAGLFTMFWASFHAIRQTDLKGILAFSTVSQLGLVMSLIGAGSLAFQFDSIEKNVSIVAITAAIFHLFNHATFKGSLFMAAGIVDHETGTRDIRRLGGLMSIMPITFTVSLFGAFSMAGLPPFNGFLSKEMFFSGMLSLLELNTFHLETWAILFPVLAWVGSIFTFLYSVLIVFKTFGGKLQLEKLPKRPHEAPFGMLVPPVILAVMVLLIGLFPGLVAKSIIEPAAASIYPALYDFHGEFPVHISIWHGFTIELLLTAGVIVLGIAGYIFLPKWKAVYQLFPYKLSLNAAYNNLFKMTGRASRNITRSYMTGYLRDYLAYLFVFFILLAGGVMAYKGAFSFHPAESAPIGIYEVILAAVMIAGSVTIVFSRSRLTAIIALGAVGYTVSLFFIFFRAPDLALTQLIIETVSVALFLLCFYHLPKLQKQERPPGLKIRNLLIAFGVGAIVTIIALSANSQRAGETISEYFLKNSYKLAGGKNVVNVILVDFRGFDTMFEITVLGIAALGIFSMVKLRKSKEGER